jgi:arsenate reductase (thioredoxin)
MAAGLLERKAGASILVRSAGSEPTDQLDPVVVEAMAEIGIDISDERPNRLETGMVRGSDVVITMGCGDVCPIFPGKRYEDWELEDPAGKDLDTVRRIRDEIAEHVAELAATLTATSGARDEIG